MGSVTSKFFKRKEPEQLYIHIYNMKQKQLVEIIMKYNDGHNGLSDCVSKMIKSINFSAYGWDVYDGKIVIYFTTNKYDAISHSYSYFVNCMDNNYRELIDYSVSLDYYFNNDPIFVLNKISTNKCVYIHPKEFTPAINNDTTAITIQEF
jgi:hypothetical protein